MKIQANYRSTAGTSGMLAVAALVLGCALFLAGDWLHAETTMTLTLRSTAFNNGAEIPSLYTCEGEDVAPPLQWEGVPGNARSLVLIVDDPDAPDPAAPRMTWVHWVVYNIPPQAGGLPEGATSETLPPGAAEGLNDWKRIGYGGPCPPVGRHRYFHKLYALDTVLEGMNKPTRAMVEAAMQGHIISATELVGNYEKSR